MTRIVAFVKSYPVVGALWRLARGAGAYGLGAALYYLANHFADTNLPIQFAPLFGVVIQAIDKFLREQGWIKYP